MAEPIITGVSAARARAPQGPTVGWADVTTTTSEEVVDMSEWAGQIVDITGEDTAHYFCFMPDATTALVLIAAAVGTVGVPETVHGHIQASNIEGEHIRCVVPKGSSFFRYRTVAGTGTLRVKVS